MAECEVEEPSRVSQVGLVLFQAFTKMKFTPEQHRRGGKGGTGEAHSRRKVIPPSLLTLDRTDSEDVFDEADAAAGESTDDEEGATEDPDLPKEVQESLKSMVEGVLDSYPLHYPNNAEHIITLLKNHPEIDPDALNNMYEAPIHAIVKKKVYSDAEREDKMATLFNFLAYSNASVDTTSTYKMTALHMAANACDVECAKVLLAFDANVNAQNAYKKTPLDLVEGPWRYFSRHDSNLAIASFLHKSKQQSVYVSAGMGRPFVTSECTDSEFVSDQRRSKFIQLLKSNGGKRDRDMYRAKPAPVSSHPQCPSHNRPPSASSFSSPQETFSEKLIASFHSHEKAICQALSSTDCESDLSASDAIALARNMKKLKMLQKAGSRILCLDGGGMKGLVQLEVLAQIEEATGRKITELFDWIIGTSIGGIIALSIVYGNVSFRALKQIAGKLRADVFRNMTHGFGGDTSAAEAIFKEYLPENLNMDDVTYPRVIITAVDKSSVNLKLHFFNNCFNDEFSTQPVWKVARYSSAAPLYFATKDNYVDGGTLSNNPVMDAITHIQAYYQREHGRKLPISVVVSVGTGILPDVSLGNIDVLERSHSWFPFREFGSKAQNLLSLIGAAITETQRASDSCQTLCQEMGISYFRFNMPLKKHLDLVIKDVESVVELLLNARQYMHDNPQLRELALRFDNLALTAQKVQDMWM